MKLVLYLFFVLAVFQFLFSFGKLYQRGLYLPDFENFYKEGVYLKQGLDPYSRVIRPCTYPPPALTVFSFFQGVDFFIAENIWFWLSVMSLVITVILFSKNTQEFLLFLGSALIFFPTKFTLSSGQINLFILLFISLSYYFWSKNRDILSGVFLGLSLMLKLTPVFLILFFLINKKFKLILSTFLTGIIGLLISAVILGKEKVIYYFTDILPTLGTGFGNGYYYNQSFSGLIARFSLASIIFYIFLFLLLLITLISKNKKEIVWAMILVLNTLFSVFSWQHHLVFLLPALWIIYKNTKVNKKLEKICLFIIFVLLALNIKNPQLFMGTSWGNLLLSHGCLGIILLWFVLFFYKNK